MIRKLIEMLGGARTVAAPDRAAPQPPPQPSAATDDSLNALLGRYKALALNRAPELEATRLNTMSETIGRDELARRLRNNKIEATHEGWVPTHEGWVRRRSRAYSTIVPGTASDGDGPVMHAEWVDVSGGASIHVTYLGGDSWRWTVLEEGAGGTPMLAHNVDLEGSEAYACGKRVRYRLYYGMDDAAMGEVKQTASRFCGFF